MSPDFGFDGTQDAKLRGSCTNCDAKWHQHDKERVYPDDGPSGSYHYKYHCPV